MRVDLTALLFALLAAAAGAVAGLATARARVAIVTAERDTARAELAGAQARLTDETRLKESFQTLAQQVVDTSGRQIVDLTRETLRVATTEARGDLEQRRQAIEHLVSPVRDALTRMDSQLRAIEGERRTAFATLAEQMRAVGETSERLRTETASLVTALRKPQARGRWGEMQLRRVVELAGMVEHCDFAEQETTATDDGVIRPDLVVKLAGEKHVVVDSKVSLDAFLDLADAVDEASRRQAAARHARQVRTHIETLAKKSYGTRVSNVPEFVVMFVPGEALLSAALEPAPDLLDFAAERNVIIATPTTLIAMLRAIAFGWRQEALAANAREIVDLGRELYDRLGTMGGHVDKLGRAVESAVRAYNDTVGSLDGRVLVSARKLADLGASTAELGAPRQVDTVPRKLQNERLVDSAERARELFRLPGAERPAELDDEL